MAGLRGRVPGIGQITPEKGGITGILPLGTVVLDRKEVAPRETIIIDTLGITYITLFIEVDRPITITLEAVSTNMSDWRRVEEPIKAFLAPGAAFVNLNEMLTTKEVLLYRFMKFRFDMAVATRVTLEAAGKLIDMAPILQDIRDILSRGLKVPTPRVFVSPAAPPPTAPPAAPPAAPPPTAPPPTAPPKPPGAVSLADILDTLEDIKKKIESGLYNAHRRRWLQETVEDIKGKVEDISSALDLRFTNPNTWQHDQKTITTPGTPVKLPGLIIPDGYALVVRAMKSNTGDVYLGNSKDNVQDSSKRITLAPDESTKLEVKKANVIWLDTDVAGEGVEFWSEKRGEET